LFTVAAVVAAITALTDVPAVRVAVALGTLNMELMAPVAAPKPQGLEVTTAATVRTDLVAAAAVKAQQVRTAVQPRANIPVGREVLGLTGKALALFTAEAAAGVVTATAQRQAATVAAVLVGRADLTRTPPQAQPTAAAAVAAVQTMGLGEPRGLELLAAQAL
jgi:hypothetical protein